MIGDTPSPHYGSQGDSGYSPEIGETKIRERLVALFESIIEKNRLCLERAREMKMEKIMSRVLVVKKRAESIKSLMAGSGNHAHYKFERMAADDERAMGEMDRELEELIRSCGDVIGDLTCMETDLHITDRFMKTNDLLRQIERLFRKRMRFARKMRVYG